MQEKLKTFHKILAEVEGYFGLEYNHKEKEFKIYVSNRQSSYDLEESFKEIETGESKVSVFCCCPSTVQSKRR